MKFFEFLDKHDGFAALFGCIIAGGIIILIITISMWLYPQWAVYQRTLNGEAQLREAEWNRRILVTEAAAKQEASKGLAQAEIERARGVAKANEIIGESLKDNESYLRYLWIMGLQDGSSEVIYIPTEAQLPILEATRKLQDVKQAEVVDGR